MNPPFNDAGEVIAVADFEYPDQHDPDEVRRAQRETVIRLLQLLTYKAKSQQIGQRALLLAYILQAIDCGSQKAMAKKLGVKQSRVSRAVKSLRAQIPHLIG
jgi:biotin operon repressor